jgi:hypothetical protein
MNVWTYWDSGTPPPIIQLCIETQKWHHSNHTHTVVSAEWVQQHGRQDILDITRNHAIAHRADMVRFWLLSEFGGLWLDADDIILQPVTIGGMLSGDVDMACPSWPDQFRPRSHAERRCTSNTIAAVAGSPIAVEALHRCRHFLSTHNRGSFFWAEPSDVLLESLLVWWLGPDRLVTAPLVPHRYLAWMGNEQRADFDHAADTKLGVASLEVGHTCMGAYSRLSGLDRVGCLADRGPVGYLLRRAFDLAPLDDPIPAFVSPVPPAPPGHAEAVKFRKAMKLLSIALR